MTTSRDRRWLWAMIVVLAGVQLAHAAAWRCTFDRPPDGWNSGQFDDSSWRSNAGPFGTGGTPGITPKADWSTPDIWLRQSITLDRNASSLQLMVFHDEDVEIYFDGTLAARAGGFVREAVPMDIRSEARALLKPGATIVLAVHCHQSGGGQGIDVRLERVTAEQLANRRRNRFRDFAMSNSGDVAAGKRLFENEQRLGCTKCHTIDGSAGRAGPDLLTVADKFPRGDLINQVLNPSSNIAVGYDTTIVTTRSGDAIVGIVKEASDESLGLMDGSGKMQRVPAAEVRSRKKQRTSLMPTDLDVGLSQQEVADLVEYLVSLRLPDVADAGRQGMPTRIEELKPPIMLTPIHQPENHFEHLTWAGELPGELGVFLVCEHETGRIYRLKTGEGEAKTLWGDFGKEIRPGGATGLLGLAFHPRFRENRKYYIQHQQNVGGKIVARVSEKIASPDFSKDSAAPSRTIIEFACSTDVHSGGGIAFGPDGYLYIGMGDTGPMGDPEGHGQNLKLLLGKMLRIDVNSDDPAKPYAIPSDNPFVGRDDARPEIWAYGFREPWRFSFDSLTHDLWVGDVGQDRIEEVDLVRRGENYGWNVYEGFDLFSTRYRSEKSTSAIPPVFAYNRRLGNSITGGYVYRDPKKQSSFEGVYICGDYTSRRVWGLKAAGDRKLSTIRQLCIAPQMIASFARDQAGAIYLVGYDGTIYKLDFSATNF